jgi:hypothetical protein
MISIKSLSSRLRGVRFTTLPVRGCRGVAQEDVAVSSSPGPVILEVIQTPPASSLENVCSECAELFVLHCVRLSVSSQGWVCGIRKLKEVVFVDVTSGSSASKVQLVCPASKKPPELRLGCPVRASGVFTEATSRGQKAEMQVDHASTSNLVLVWIPIL